MKISRIILKSFIFENSFGRVDEVRKKYKGIDLKLSNHDDSSRIIFNNVIPKVEIERYLEEKQSFLIKNGINLNLSPGVITELEILGINTNTFFIRSLKKNESVFKKAPEATLRFHNGEKELEISSIEIWINRKIVMKVYEKQERTHVDFKFVALDLKVKDFTENKIDSLLRDSIQEIKKIFWGEKQDKIPTFVEVLEKILKF